MRSRILQKKDILKLIEDFDREQKMILLQNKQLAESKNEGNKRKCDRRDFYRESYLDLYKDGFIMEYPHGTVIRQSKTNWYFRGERICYPTSQPTFVRSLYDKSEEEKLILEFMKNVKIIEFNYILSYFDHYKEFKNMRLQFPPKVDTSISVLTSCIAQHYGLNTNWLDITGDLNAALFFACCKNENGKWMPLNEEDVQQNPYGRLFRKQDDIQWIDYEVFPIGFQPFMRCHMQHGYGIWMNEDMDLTSNNSQFEILTLQHSVSLSEYIFEKMDEGRKVYPHEGLSFILDEIEELKHSKNIPDFIFDRTYRAMLEEGLFEKDISESELKILLQKYGYSISSDTIQINAEKIDKVNQHYRGLDRKSVV